MLLVYIHMQVYMFTQHHNSTGQTHCVLVFFFAAVDYIEKIQQQIFQSHNIITVHTIIITMGKR